jgi:tetratricopeptide (TPR) repeat protein
MKKTKESPEKTSFLQKFDSVKASQAIEKVLTALSTGWKPFLLFFIVILALFAQTLNYENTSFDDNFILTNIQKRIKDFGDLDKAFTTDAFVSKLGLSYYRPLQTVSFFIDNLIGTSFINSHHLFNITFHILTCFLLFVLLNKLGFKRSNNMLITLFYCIHPLFTKAVVWIPSRGDLLIAFFGVISFIMLINLINKKNIVFYILHILFFAFSMFSKESTILFPLIFFYYIIINQKQRVFSLRNLALALSYGAVIALYMILRSFVVVSLPSDDSFGLSVVIGNLPVIPELISKSVLPINLSTMPTFSTISTITGIIFIIVLLFITIKQRKTLDNKLILFGFLWFLALISVTLLFRIKSADLSDYDYLEHRAYLPLFGMVLVLSEILSKSRLKLNNVVVFSIIGAIFLYFSTVTFLHSQDFSNPKAFYERAIATNPTNSMAYNNYGLYYFNNVEYDKAEEMLKQSLKYNPRYALPHYNLGRMFDSLNRLSEAEYYSKNAVKYMSYEPKPYNLLGMILAKQNKIDTSAIVFSNGLKIDSNVIDLYINLAHSLYLKGDVDKSIDLLMKAKARRFSDYRAYKYLGYCYIAKKETDVAREYLNTAMQYGEEIRDIYFLIGKSYLVDNKFDLALENFYKTLELDSSFTDVYFELGNLFLKYKKSEKALEWYKKSLEKNPKLFAAYRKIADIYLQEKQTDSAIAAYKAAARQGDRNVQAMLVKNKIQW